MNCNGQRQLIENEIRKTRQFIDNELQITRSLEKITIKKQDIDFAKICIVIFSIFWLVVPDIACYMVLKVDKEIKNLELTKIEKQR